MPSQSMPRFAAMLQSGMVERGHDVEVWTSEKFFLKIPVPAPLRKWVGYLDQYLVFPLQIRNRLGKSSRDTLFVFADQALGPWVPVVSGRPHVIHCHDFLAQRSALGEIPENPTGRTGKWYQAYIRQGFRQGRNFISVSEKTRSDLNRFVNGGVERSEMVYNGLNQEFGLVDPSYARTELRKLTSIDLDGGYLLHVGGNQWYKNRIGVIEIYNAWRAGTNPGLPLLMIGPKASGDLQAMRDASPFRDDIHLLAGLDDVAVRLAYAGSAAFIFPSLAEGFGWPIAEAMASGCPVLTTDEAPMTEVAGEAAFLIPRRPQDESQTATWAARSADVLQKLVSLSDDERKNVVTRGIANAKRFDSAAALDQIARIYSSVLAGR
ncbi:glycosyltransferase family 4 protein [Luteolibacter yonseiensis]|uniref:Glycosyltransferase family 4 protein n=2 Tax=Luteolibacter yonseiensis TaxID=1144680 RepID=A0A934R4R4_9BACT|nr:glycosyltransferase family 4 protein [Luteolibacter yonseiensis]